MSHLSTGPLKKYFDEFGKDVTHEVKTMIENAEKQIKSDPPVGMFKVTNLYVELVEGNPKFIFQWDDGEPE